MWARGSLIDAIQMTKGWYSKATGLADPPFVTTMCPVGTYCPPGSYEPIKCPTGFFRDNSYGQDADACGPCPAGTYCDEVGTSVPKDCPKGQFCPEGSAQPQPCPVGTYNPNLKVYDSRGCTACDPGRYCPFMGQEAVDNINH